MTRVLFYMPHITGAIEYLEPFDICEGLKGTWHQLNCSRIIQLVIPRVFYMTYFGLLGDLNLHLKHLIA